MPPAKARSGRATCAVPFGHSRGASSSNRRIRAWRPAGAAKNAEQSIPGVARTGLSLGMADAVLVQDGEQVQVKQRP
jgi:hypothetical protein